MDNTNYEYEVYDGFGFVGYAQTYEEATVLAYQNGESFSQIIRRDGANHDTETDTYQRGI